MTQIAFYGDEELRNKIVQRAKEHEYLGTIKQKTYGEFELVEPGTAEFRGCAVGCLVQPTQYITLHDGWQTDEEFKRWLGEQDDIQKGASDDSDNYDTYKKLRKEFNFSNNLCFVIEGIFETLDPSDAKGWPFDIVNALSHTTDVSNETIEDIIESNQNLQCILGYAGRDIIGFDDVPDLTYLEDVYWEEIIDNEKDFDASKAAEFFISAISHC